jgi:membrane protein implicated in regulation of membrane protease activity
MFPGKSTPAKTGLVMFLGAFLLGLAILVLFGLLAGAFTSDQGIIAALTASPLGFIALFGATLMLAAPLIGLTIWAYDRAIQSATEQQKQQQHRRQRKQ